MLCAIKPDKSKSVANQEFNSVTYSELPLINLSQHIDKDSIMLEYNYKKKRFLFHDKDKIFMGSFSTEELVKYIVYDKVPTFMSNINHSGAKPIIEKYLCVNKDSNIIINNHLESPFTGHIEMLIKLYKNLEDYEKNGFKLELVNMTQTECEITTELFKNFIYILLNHILKIISILSEVIDKDDDLITKTTLIKYSVAISYKISCFIRNKISDKLSEIENLKVEKNKLDELKNSFSKNILELENILNNQNDTINSFLDKESITYDQFTDDSSKSTDRSVNYSKSSDRSIDNFSKTSDQSINNSKSSDRSVDNSKSSDQSINNSKSSDKISNIYNLSSMSPLFKTKSDVKTNDNFSLEQIVEKNPESESNIKKNKYLHDGIFDI